MLFKKICRLSLTVLMLIMITLSVGCDSGSGKDPVVFEGWQESISIDVDLGEVYKINDLTVVDQNGNTYFYEITVKDHADQKVQIIGSEFEINDFSGYKIIYKVTVDEDDIRTREVVLNVLDKNKPQISVSLPTGFINEPYTIPSISVVDDSGEDITPNYVLYKKDDQTKTHIEVQNDTFTPTTSGGYVLEVTAKDSSDNVEVKQFEFAVRNAVAENVLENFDCEASLLNSLNGDQEWLEEFEGRHGVVHIKGTDSERTMYFFKFIHEASFYKHKPFNSITVKMYLPKYADLYQSTTDGSDAMYWYGANKEKWLEFKITNLGDWDFLFNTATSDNGGQIFWTWTKNTDIYIDEIICDVTPNIELGTNSSENIVTVGSTVDISATVPTDSRLVPVITITNPNDENVELIDGKFQATVVGVYIITATITSEEMPYYNTTKTIELVACDTYIKVGENYTDSNVGRDYYFENEQEINTEYTLESAVLYNPITKQALTSDVSVAVKYNDTDVDVTNGKFTPTEEGYYDIIYTATYEGRDYVTNCKLLSIRYELLEDELDNFNNTESVAQFGYGVSGTGAGDTPQWLPEYNGRYGVIKLNDFAAEGGYNVKLNKTLEEMNALKWSKILVNVYVEEGVWLCWGQQIKSAQGPINNSTPWKNDCWTVVEINKTEVENVQSFLTALTGNGAQLFWGWNLGNVYVDSIQFVLAENPQITAKTSTYFVNEVCNVPVINVPEEFNNGQHIFKIYKKDDNTKTALVITNDTFTPSAVGVYVLEVTAKNTAGEDFVSNFEFDVRNKPNDNVLENFDCKSSLINSLNGEQEWLEEFEGKQGVLHIFGKDQSITNYFFRFIREKAFYTQVPFNSVVVKIYVPAYIDMYETTTNDEGWHGITKEKWVDFNITQFGNWDSFFNGATSENGAQLFWGWAANKDVYIDEIICTFNTNLVFTTSAVNNQVEVDSEVSVSACVPDRAELVAQISVTSPSNQPVTLTNGVFVATEIGDYTVTVKIENDNELSCYNITKVYTITCKGAVFEGELTFDNAKYNSVVYGKDQTWLDSYKDANGVVKATAISDWDGIQFRLNATVDELKAIDWDVFEFKMTFDFSSTRSSWDGMYESSAGWSYVTNGEWRIYYITKANIIAKYTTIENFYTAITTGTNNCDNDRLFTLWNFGAHGNYYIDYIRLSNSKFNGTLSFDGSYECATVSGFGSKEYLADYEGAKGVLKGSNFDANKGICLNVNATVEQLKQIVWTKIEIRMTTDSGQFGSVGLTDNLWAAWKQSSSTGKWKLYTAKNTDLVTAFGSLDNLYTALTTGSSCLLSFWDLADRGSFYIDYIKFVNEVDFDFSNSSCVSAIRYVTDATYHESYNGAEGVLSFKQPEYWLGIQLTSTASKAQLQLINWTKIEFRVTVDFTGEKTKWEGNPYSGWTYVTDGDWRIYTLTKESAIANGITLEKIYTSITGGTDGWGDLICSFDYIGKYGNIYLDYFRIV